MTGKLNEHPLPELIREIVAEKLSGSLRVEQERIKAAVFFDKGALRYAASNLRPHRLAESLRRWRVITDEQFASLPQGGTSDADVARTLLEQKVLTEEALSELRSRLAADVLRPALLWTTGAWAFEPRARLLDDVRVSIELEELLMEAARRFPINLAAARFPNTNEKLQPAREVANNLDLLPMEAFVLSRIDAPLRLHELLSISGLTREETLQACYALALGGFVERDAWPRAFSPDEVAKALKASAAAAERSAQPAQEARTVQAARPSEPKKTEEVPKSVEPEVDERRELEELFERMSRATNHYQVLGVTRNVEQDALKQTYHRLARRFHPDRFHQDAEIHRRVEDAFAKIAQAYEVLRDKKTRAAYDLKIAREPQQSAPSTQARTEPRSEAQSSVRAPQSSTASTPAERAEESFQKGLGALKAGNFPTAFSALAEAARLAPQVARYRAHYGEALAANVQMRHRAEAEIQAAILIEPSNASYRIMLARLYQNLGFIKRAQGELERVCALDPRNEEAKKMLAQLQSTQGAR
jgi:curved DNA-binding protein CbpA